MRVKKLTYEERQQTNNNQSFQFADHDGINNFVLTGLYSEETANLVLRHTKNSTENSYISLIGVDFGSAYHEIENKCYKIRIYNFRNNTARIFDNGSNLRSLQGVVIAVDLTDKKSLTHAEEVLQTLKRKSNDNNFQAKVSLVGIKPSGLYSNKEAIVTEQELVALADKFNLNKPIIVDPLAKKDAEKIDGIFTKFIIDQHTERKRIAAQEEQRKNDLAKIDTYISKRRTSDKDYYFWAKIFNGAFGGYFDGYSKKQKLEAAEALKKVCRGSANFKTLKTYKKVLKQGDLGKIYNELKPRLKP